jgi:hypothetical protein
MDNMETRDDESSHALAFIELLIGDVLAARERLSTSDSQTARRDVVRASLAAMEGLIWEAREHVREVLAGTDQLSPVANLALRELSYVVSEKGQLIEQMRSVPLLTAIRFVVSQAKIISPEISVAFSAAGWADLRQAIDIRNRITHPKPYQDLAISDHDLDVVGSGLSWLLATVEYVMASTNLAFARHAELMRKTVERLRAGDPDALAEYLRISREIDEAD